MSALSTSMSVYYAMSVVHAEVRRDLRSLGTGIMSVYKPPIVC